MVSTKVALILSTKSFTCANMYSKLTTTYLYIRGSKGGHVPGTLSPLIDYSNLARLNSLRNLKIDWSAPKSLSFLAPSLSNSQTCFPNSPQHIFIFVAQKDLMSNPTLASVRVAVLSLQDSKETPLGGVHDKDLFGSICSRANWTFGEVVDSHVLRDIAKS